MEAVKLWDEDYLRITLDESARPHVINHIREVQLALTAANERIAELVESAEQSTSLEMALIRQNEAKQARIAELEASGKDAYNDGFLAGGEAAWASRGVAEGAGRLA